MAQEQQEFPMPPLESSSGEEREDDESPSPNMVLIRELAEKCERGIREIDEQRAECERAIRYIDVKRAAERAALDVLLKRERELLREERKLRAAVRAFKFPEKKTK